MTIASPDPNVELAPAILFQTERVVSTLPTSASLRSAARASKPAPPPPPPAVGASFSGARFSSSSRFHHPRSNLCHPSEPAHIVPAPPHPQRGQALTEAPRAPRAMRPLFTSYESAPRDARCPTPPSPSPTAEFSVCAPTHRPRRSPPGRPAHYDHLRDTRTRLPDALLRVRRTTRRLTRVLPPSTPRASSTTQHPKMNPSCPLPPRGPARPADACTAHASAAAPASTSRPAGNSFPPPP